MRKFYNPLKIILFILIVIILIFSLIRAIHRWNIEKSNRTVELVLDFREIQSISEISNYDIDYLISEFHSAGLNSIAICEEEKESKYDIFHLSDNENRFVIKRIDWNIMELIQRYGLKAILRPSNPYWISRKYIEDYFSQIKDWSIISGIVFEGKEVMGYPNHIQYIIKEIQNQDIKIGVIEFAHQLGIERIGKELPHKFVRVHSIKRKNRFIEQNILINRYIRAIRERGVRILYLHILPGDFQDNRRFFSRLREKIISEGFKLGYAEPFIDKGEYFGSPLLRYKNKYPTYLLSTIVAIFIPLFGLVILYRSIKSENPGELSPVFACLVNFLMTCGVTLIGALILVGILSRIDFMLKLDQMRGVKLCLILPIIIGFFYLYVKSKGSSYLIQLKNLMNSTVKCKHLIYLTIFVLSIVVMIIRSGNTGLIPVSVFENSVREFIERIFGVRPRIKEFLIGHPLMLLGIYLTLNRKRLLHLSGEIFLALGLIGQISIINTFCHIHTPLEISLCRTFHGLWLGVILGLMPILLLERKDE